MQQDLISWLKGLTESPKSFTAGFSLCLFLYSSGVSLLFFLGLIEVHRQEIKGESAKAPTIEETPPPILENRKDFLNNIELWDMRYFYSQVDGEYCLRNSSVYDHQFLWYKNPIWLVDNNYSFKFKVSSEKGFGKNIPSVSAKVVIAFGNKVKISEFFLPAFGDQVINFLQTVPGSFELRSIEPGRQLTFSVQENTTLDLNIETKLMTSNLVSFLYKITYIPKNSDKSLTDDFSYSVRIDDPNGRTDFGIGIYGHGCIRPIDYLFK